MAKFDCIPDRIRDLTEDMLDSCWDVFMRLNLKLIGKDLKINSE